MQNITHHRVKCIVGIGCITATGMAFGAPDLSLRLDASFGHNSNVFLTGENNTPVQDGPARTGARGTGTQQQSMTISAGMPLDSDFTRLQLSASLGHQKFNQVPQLNTNTHDIGARLPWRFSDIFEGNFAAGHSATPYPVDESYQGRDLVKRSWQSGVLTYKLSGSISLPFQYQHSQTSYQDREFHARLDEHRRLYGAAARYASPTGSTLQVGANISDVNFPGRQMPDEGSSWTYRDRDLYGDVDWITSPLLRTSGRLTYRHRSYSDPALPSTSYWTYRFAGTYTLSPKTRFDASLWHDNAVSDDPRVNVSRVTGYAASMLWQATAKTSASINFVRTTQSDSPTPDASGTRFNDPTTTRFGLRVQSEVERGFAIYAEGFREHRVGSITGAANQNSIRLGIEYSYENTTGALQRNTSISAPAP